MERLSALDALFLEIENPQTHMQVASLLVFEGDLGLSELQALVAGRLHLVPRLRQKLAPGPLGRGLPTWLDDAEFDITRHIGRVTLPRPIADAELREICGLLLSSPLDRRKPLWEMRLIGPLVGDRFGVLVKAHHCVCDGIAGAEILALILDTNPDAPFVEPQPWEPEKPPSGIEQLTEAVREQVQRPGRFLGGVRRLLSDPKAAVRTAAEVLGNAGAVARAILDEAPRSPLNVTLGPTRRLETVTASLDDVKALKKTYGVTVNDVVLAACGGALGTWLREGGTDLQELKVMVPVSVRTMDEHGQLGNRVSMVTIPVPTAEDDAVTRLRRVRQSAADAKRSRQAAATESLNSLASLAPVRLLPIAAKLQSARRLFNIYVTNVPGPDVPLYAGPHRLIDFYPVAPLGANNALNVAVLSYDGTLGFGILADAEAIPDAARFAEALEKSLHELTALADVRPLPRARITQLQAPFSAGPARRRVSSRPRTARGTIRLVSSGRAQQ